MMEARICGDERTQAHGLRTMNGKCQRWPATAACDRGISFAFAGMLALASVATAVDALKPNLRNAVSWRDGQPVELLNPSRPEVNTARVYQPRTEWTYSHHPHLTFFRGRYFAIWSNGHRDEDAPGQRILISTATNFAKWSEPRPLVDSTTDANGVERVLTAAGFHQHHGNLVAYFANYGPKKETTHLLAVTTTNGVDWSAPQSVGLPVCPNSGPLAVRGGRFILSGHIAFPYTDDPTGLTGWQMAGLYPKAMAATVTDDPASFWRVARANGWGAAVCEGSVFQTDDGVIHVPLRSTGSQFRHRLWLTESRDNGVSYSEPVETEFSDTDAKFQFGRLPDGRFFYVGNPVGAGRTPLVLALSQDGVNFDRNFILGEQRYEMPRPGRSKGGEYGYPNVLIHDGWLHVIVSRQKEGIEVLRVKP